MGLWIGFLRGLSRQYPEDVLWIVMDRCSAFVLRLAAIFLFSTGSMNGVAMARRFMGTIFAFLLMPFLFVTTGLAQSDEPKISENFHGTPLMVAAYRHDSAAVQKLLDEKTDVNKPNDLGLTALYYAAGATPTGEARDDKASYETAKLLLDHGADPRLSGKKTGVTPLMAATQNGLVETAKLLMERGADVNAKTVDGRTALMDALDGHRWLIVDTLLSGEVDMNEAIDANGHDALMHAVGAVRPLASVPTLSFASALFHGMPVEATDMLDGANVVDRLLIAGAKIDHFDKEGQSAFLLAAVECHNLLVKSFLKHGVDVNQRNKTTEQTALMQAARCGNAPMTKTLLDHSADKTLKDKDGKTALDYAQESSAVDVVKLLGNSAP